MMPMRSVVAGDLEASPETLLRNYVCIGPAAALVEHVVVDYNGVVSRIRP
jgi:hypothetical protein